MRFSSSDQVRERKETPPQPDPETGALFFKAFDTAYRAQVELNDAEAKERDEEWARLILANQGLDDVIEGDV